MSGATEARAVARALADAPNRRIAQAVALVDALPARGAADALIAPLRGRLAELRIGRRVNFGRLLFLPLDPVIVDAKAWRPGAAAVPRSALAPLIVATRAALGADGDSIAAALREAGQSAPMTLPMTLGPLLWTPAAAALRTLAAAKLPGWDTTGLPAEAAGPIARAVAAVLDAWPALCALAARDKDSRDLADVLRAAAAEGPEPWALVVAVAIARGADPVPVATLAADLAGQGGPAMHQALEGALAAATDALEQQTHAPAELAAGAVRRAGRLVAALVDRTGPAQRAALLGFAGRIDADCRARVAAECATAVMTPLAALAPATIAADLPGLERAARGLRDLEQEARRIGGANAYDTLFRDAAARVRDLPESHPLTRMDRMRLVEILDGPEAALRLLDG